MISTILSFFSSFKVYLICGALIVMVSLAGVVAYEIERNQVVALTAQTAALTKANNDAQATIQRLQQDSATVSLDTSTATSKMASAASQQAQEAITIETVAPIKGKPDPSLGTLLTQMGQASNQ